MGDLVFLDIERAKRRPPQILGLPVVIDASLSPGTIEIRGSSGVQVFKQEELWSDPPRDPDPIGDIEKATAAMLDAARWPRG